MIASFCQKITRISNNQPNNLARRLTKLMTKPQLNLLQGKERKKYVKMVVAYQNLNLIHSAFTSWEAIKSKTSPYCLVRVNPDFITSLQLCQTSKCDLSSSFKVLQKEITSCCFIMDLDEKELSRSLQPFYFQFIFQVFINSFVLVKNTDICSFYFAIYY